MNLFMMKFMIPAFKANVFGFLLRKNVVPRTRFLEPLRYCAITVRSAYPLLGSSCQYSPGLKLVDWSDIHFFFQLKCEYIQKEKKKKINLHVIFFGLIIFSIENDSIERRVVINLRSTFLSNCIGKDLMFLITYRASVWIIYIYL